MKSKRIYVVDDEERIRELVKTYLQKEGYEVYTFNNGQQALEAFQKSAADMLILDIMMPEMDGYALCREIRKISEVPIIMVSAKDEELDRILGLELGSDDYISKPFSPRELVARVKTIFRRLPGSRSEEEKREAVQCWDIVIYPGERKVCRRDLEVELTTKEYDFLYYLIRNKNRVFTREQLLNSIWGYDFIGDTRAIDDLVKRIRKKLEKTESIMEITTVWGYGYKISE